MADIKKWQQRVIANKIRHGFNTKNIDMEFALTYGELAEAYDAWHKKTGTHGEELADTAIYLLGLAELLGVDLEKEITAKLEVNEKRKYVHKKGVFTKEDK